MKKYDQQRLFEVMGRLDKTFKPKQQLNEWNFDKKKGEGEEDKDEEKKETPEHEESETPAEEKAEHEEGKKDEVDEATTKPKVPVNMIAKVGGK